MNIFFSGVKTIFKDKMLRTKLLWRLMTFVTVKLLFDIMGADISKVDSITNFLDHTMLQRHRDEFWSSMSFQILVRLS
jgi:hypothetical protein